MKKGKKNKTKKTKKTQKVNDIKDYISIFNTVKENIMSLSFDEKKKEIIHMTNSLTNSKLYQFLKKYQSETLKRKILKTKRKKKIILIKDIYLILKKAQKLLIKQQ